ncbi:STAS domain-containing protein [Streptomyces indicus]|uniref:Anti-anti-sigma factor n=1 Tax=Streptomyces indicus TaxID=417292 RepID=A0A1G8U6P5_9ACTN|nr:STAS domain-containing protein [Streptomyces indicus]SDJ48785.1 anti-anti-sigma factor [Streptomyces indicus]
MRRDGDRLTVELHGELDVAMVLDIEDPLLQELRLPTSELVLDIRLLTFVDCSGIALIERLRRRLELTDGSMVLVCTDPFVLRILSYLGVPETIPVLEAPPHHSHGAPSAPESG